MLLLLCGGKKAKSGQNQTTDATDDRLGTNQETSEQISEKSHVLIYFIYFFVKVPRRLSFDL